MSQNRYIGRLDKTSYNNDAHSANLRPHFLVGSSLISNEHTESDQSYLSFDFHLHYFLLCIK